MKRYLLVATPADVVRFGLDEASVSYAEGLDGKRPTGLSADPRIAGRVWCATDRGGVFRSDDAGATWRPAGLESERFMAVAVSPAPSGRIWAGTEPSAVWRSDDGGQSWTRTANLEELPSSPQWAFPPRPDTHHVRWIAPHPQDTDRLWVAIEAGALVRTWDGGRTWADRVESGPWDTHELAVHPESPETLRVSAGDGYYESHDGGDTWASPMEGMEVGYLRSVAIVPGDPGIVVVSASTGPRTSYVTGRSDGRLYRRKDGERWSRVTDGWPDPPSTIAPLLIAGAGAGEIWAADDRGVHGSEDGGLGWRTVGEFDRPPDHLRGFALATDPEG
jgi:photosystem II stability/assembly factor-like uncharacterized protein